MLKRTYLKTGLFLGIIFTAVTLVYLFGEIRGQTDWAGSFSKIFGLFIILPKFVGDKLSLVLAELIGLLKSPPAEYCNKSGLGYPCAKVATKYFKRLVLDKFYITNFLITMSSFVIFSLWGMLIGLIQGLLAKRDGRGYRFLYFLVPVALILLIIIVPFIIGAFLFLSSFS